MSVEIDMTEVRRFAADVTRLPGQLSRHVNPILNRGALNVKKQMQADLNASSNGGIRRVAATVSYDVKEGPGFMEAEIGPSKPDGGLANIAYFGTAKGGGHTTDPMVALEAEAGEFEKHLADLVEDLWGR